MKTKGAAGAAALIGVGIGVQTVRKHFATKHEQDDGSRWLGVTINKSPDQVGAEGQLPEPLARLGDHIEIRIRPASGDKGTELYARLRDSARATHDAREVRMALRHAKSIIETGEVLQPDAHPSTHPGLVGKVLQAANPRSRGEGRL